MQYFNKSTRKWFSRSRLKFKNLGWSSIAKKFYKAPFLNFYGSLNFDLGSAVFKERSPRYIYYTRNYKFLFDKKRATLSHKRFKRNLFRSISALSFVQTGFFRRRFKYYFKRNSMFRSFMFGLRSKRSIKATIRSYSLESKKSSLTVSLIQSKNNLFYSVLAGNGRQLIYAFSNGQTFYKGSKRLTPVAAESAGRKISNLLYGNKIRSITIRLTSPITSVVRAAIRGLATRLSFSSIQARVVKPHNGMRMRATRRV